jgi:hypothetical protein
MPTEPKAERIAAALVANLGAIQSEWGYAPTAVRADVVDERLLDASVGTVYAVTPDHKEERRATNDGPGCIIDARAFYTLTLLTRHTTNDRPLDPDLPLRQTVQERMCSDVRKKLREDPSLGGLSIDLTLTESEENPNETTLPGWALAFMRATVRYHYVKDAP